LKQFGSVLLGFACCSGDEDSKNLEKLYWIQAHGSNDADNGLTSRVTLAKGHPFFRCFESGEYVEKTREKPEKSGNDRYVVVIPELSQFFCHASEIDIVR